MSELNLIEIRDPGYVVSFSAGGGRPPVSSLRDEAKKHKLRRRRVQISAPAVSVSTSSAAAAGCSNQDPRRRRLVLRLQGQLEVSSEQLLVKWREVRANSVGVNRSER